MTLPPSYSWSPVNQPVSVAYEAPQGRRVNVLGAYFSQGPQAGRFLFQAYASLPKSKAKKDKTKKQRKTPEQIAAAHGLTPEEVGSIDAARFLSFVWRVAGRPGIYLEGWKRERPLVLVLDNYSVHASLSVQEEMSALSAANVHLFFLPSYSPELSEIEPIWQAVKHHEMPERSFTAIRGLKVAVEDALARKAQALLQTQQRQDEQQPTTRKTDKLLCHIA